MSKEIINLNLIMSYPVKWNRYKVFRDFIQNFYDSVPYDEFIKRFSYKFEDGVLRLECSNVKYNYEWLLHIGASTKTNSSENSAGYFGEGFKVAALCGRRDFGYDIEVSSSNWNIHVTESDILIDGNIAKTLAYELERYDKEEKNSILILRNLDEEDYELFITALYSFYYIGNPLLGEKIYSDDKCAIYKRSEVEKPYHYPSTFSVYGNGIVFAAFQARGSLKEDLIYCYHDHKSDDRDREFFSEISNIDIIVQCIYCITPEVAKELLIMHKRLWYSYPKEKFGYRSYYTVIKNLIFKMEKDSDIVKEFIDEYPKLLFAEKLTLSDRRSLNERKYCLNWIKNNKDYSLVQDTFKYIGVQSIESKCREEDILPRVSMPEKLETKYIKLLEECAKEIFLGFFNTTDLPNCMVINNLNASVSGYASLIKNKEKTHNLYGYLYKYEIQRVCIKSSNLQKDRFSTALSVYIHELCHTFGGDKSEVFSYALTDALEILIEKHDVVERYRKMWEEV